jgi:hypothetical protein
MADARISQRNPRTLAQVGRAVPLDAWGAFPALSPDGALLALVAVNSSPRSIRFLDVRHMRWTGGAVRIPTLGSGAVRWADERTVTVLGERPDGLRAVVVDVDRRRVVRTVRVPGHLEGLHAQSTAAGMTVLLQSLTYRPMGPVLIGVVGASGKVRVAEIDRVQAGSAHRPRRPALVADPLRSNAYVFGGLDEPVAEVDLRTMRVVYHALRGLPPLQETLGANRFGAWLGRGRIALFGWDDSATATRRLGVSLVDTRTWRLRRIDRDADFFVLADGLLLAPRLDQSLGVFGLDGRPRFSVSEPVFQLGYTVSNGRYIYAYNLPPGAQGSALVVDAKTGASSWPRAPLFGQVFSPGLVVPGS